MNVNTAFAARRLEYDIGIGFSDDIDQAPAPRDLAVVFGKLVEARTVRATESSAQPRKGG